MRIVYFANHRCGKNDDEGAIAFALKELGHDVQLMPEEAASTVEHHDGDFLLFHHFKESAVLYKWDYIPKVLWCFDLINFPDDTLRARNERRVNWMKEITPAIDLAFCTDGDWVNQDKSGKFVRLPQGADSRVAGPGSGYNGAVSEILFMGTARGGIKRQSHLDGIEDRYNSRFRIISHPFWIYRRALAGMISKTKVVIAPDGPVTDHYWSNRVYVTLGFGGVLLHPYCKTLTDQYEPEKELMCYKDRDEFYFKLEFLLNNPGKRKRLQEAGFYRTMKEHTYYHRCKVLIDTVKDKLGIG